MRKLLFVDDEPRILEGFRRSLRPLRHEWTFEFAEGALAALRMLESNQFDVVITDMRMPGMDGLDLLRELVARYPSLLRIALSGQFEDEDYVRCSGLTHQYLKKPCSLEELKTTVGLAFSLAGY